MKISHNMDLNELAEVMGGETTLAEAAHMRAMLDGLGRFSSTDEVPAGEWDALLNDAVAQARLDD